MNRRVLTLAATLLAASAIVGCARRYSDVATSPAEGAPPAPPPPAAEPAPAPAPAAPSSLQSEERDESESSRQTPISAESAGPLTLDQAVAEFERAKTELEGALRLSANATSGSGAPGAGAAAPARARPSSPPRATADAPKDRAEKKAQSETSCQTACRAFASLERAADSVCRLAGPKDARCTRAQEIVTAHTPRVASCGCQPDER